MCWLRCCTPRSAAISWAEKGALCVPQRETKSRRCQTGGAPFTSGGGQLQTCRGWRSWGGGSFTWKLDRFGAQTHTSPPATGTGCGPRQVWSYGEPCFNHLTRHRPRGCCKLPGERRGERHTPDGEETSLRPQPQFLFLTSSLMVIFLLPASVSLSVTSEICSVGAGVPCNAPAISARRRCYKDCPASPLGLDCLQANTPHPPFPPFPVPTTGTHSSLALLLALVCCCTTKTSKTSQSSRSRAALPPVLPIRSGMLRKPRAWTRAQSAPLTPSTETPLKGLLGAGADSDSTSD